MNKRQLEGIVNNSRRDALMADYVAKHGGEFVKGRAGWEYIEEKVVHNQVKKVEKRKVERKKAVENKSFWKKKTKE